MFQGRSRWASRRSSAATTHRAWTGDDQAHNDSCRRRWLANLNRSTGEPGYQDEWYWQQCGGCRYWIALHGGLGADFGACTNPTATFDGRVRFEHDGCTAYTEREDGSFG